jgi:predicted dehydrogenase
MPERAVANSAHADRENGLLFGPKPPLTVACIGAGDIVRATHLPVLKAMPQVEVSWVADVNEARAREMAKVYKVPFRALPENLAELPPADVYLLACPFGVRDPYYRVLRDRTVSLYVEKPFARTSERHAELCSWFPDYGLASGLMMRCYGPNLIVRQVLQQQLFGRLRAVRFGFGKPGLVTQGNYYYEPGRGGAGMISEVGIHGIDAALFVGRATRAEMESVNTVLQDDVDLHTEARLIATNAEGQKFVVEFTISSLQPTIEGVEVECEHATLSYPLPGQGYALIAEKVNTDVVVRPKDGGATYTIQPRYGPLHATSKFQMFHEYWKMFLEGVATKTANWTSARQAQLTTEVIENCYRFSHSGAVGVGN